MTEINSIEINDSYDDCILYELLVYSEWKQDPELLKHPRGSDSRSFGISYQDSTKYLLQYFRKENVSDEVRRILLRQLPWQFAVGEGGKVVAILQETILEIRTSRDEYSSIIGKASIAKDLTPQWRKLSWSPDCSMLAVGHSNGVVSFYDLLGSNLFNIYPQRFQENQQQPDKNRSLAYLGFIQSRRRSPKWSAELVLVDYQGNLHCYLVSPTDGYQESHSFSFEQHYPYGITAVSYHSTHNMIFIAGPPSIKNLDVLKNHGSSMGLSTWRLLNDYPYCTLALSLDEEQAICQAQRSWWNWIPSVTVKNRTTIIFKMQVSPGGKFLACLHSCGSFSIWHLPALRLYKFWNLQEQPHYDVRNPLDKRRSDYSNNYSSHPVDVNWWSDHAVIIARHSGAISVCSIGNLHNLLGDSPEFLAGPPQVSALCSDQGFLGLECESILTSKKWSWDEYTMLSEMESSDDNEEDSDAEASLLNKSSALLQTAMYVVTDIERFQPKKKKPKLCYRTYRLLGLKSTTPDELYARKIDNEEYGEALALAKAYNLDCDLVYQRQWRNNKVSVVTIHDYLSKVTKRTWVLKECVERVPETFGAARELLQFGLHETNAENIFDFDDNDEILKVDDSTECDAAERIKKMEDRLTKIVLNDLTPEQQTLVRYRQQLLEYCDRLITYELIMGGPHMTEDYYDFMFYDKFRTVSLIESTVKFARESNWRAVEIMFTYHGGIILPHWLPVLSNFPETLNPYEYRSLIPECDAEGHLFKWNEIQLRDQDWCEKSNFQEPDNKSRDADSEFLYQEDEALSQFLCSDGLLGSNTLTLWFVNRVHIIENQSCMVDYALSLTKLGRERNITGLENLYSQLLTLDTLVYDVHLENIRLTDIQKMSQLDICKLLMSKSSASTFIDDLKHLLLPFLLRCEKSSPGSRRHLLHAYLTELSSHGLSLPLKLFEYVHNENPNLLVPTLEEKMSLALSSIYAYPDCDQLPIAFHILQYIPERSYGGQNPTITALQNQLNELECDLHAAEILQRNSICKPLSFIQDNKSVVNVAQQLLVRLARNIAKNVQPPTDREWEQLLNDIRDLQKICFSCVSIETCFEIYVATILSSGCEKNIRSAVDFLECQVGYSSRKISYNNSVKLVLNAAMEYFDSASTLEDPVMDLARTCLSLITDENEDIKELQDLIAALQLLSDFGINMLPLQVRLCTDRVRLVQMSIQSKPTAYRNKQKLFQLANKLQVCGKNQRQREGTVLVLIAEAALEALDYQFCAEICQELVLKSHAIGWQVVQKLGQCEDFDNFPLRCELIGFALLFCPTDLIEVLVDTRCSLEVKLLCEKINTMAKQETAASDEEEFSDALTSPLTPSKEFKTLLNIIEVAVESVKNTAFISPTSSANKNICVSPDDSERSENQAFEKQGFPAFYSDLQPDCHISCFSTKYDRFAVPDIDPVVKVSQAFLCTLQLEGTISRGKFEKNVQVLLQLSEKYLPEEATFGLGYLLPIDDLSVADTCFSHLICSSLALQLAAYFYSLKGYKEIQGCSNLNVENQRNIYYIPPSKLIEHMSHVASELDESVDWAKLLMKYQKLMIDFQQGERLQRLGCGVDLERFTHDKQYQQDSILGLAMTVDSEKFSLAITLASHHGLPLSEVVARHLASLLLNTEENQNSDVATHLTDSKLADLVKISPHLICERLSQYAYPNIEGTDHQLLLSYYTVLQTIAEDFISYDLTPKEHIKLIRKVKTASSDIDYKKMVDPSYNLLDVAIPALQRNNIGMIAKLLKSLPSSLKCTVEPGKLYSSWAQKEFFKVSVPVAQASQNDWVEQYELCKTCFNKMAASDILDFVRGTCFSEQGINTMSTECREIIVIRTKENCLLRIYPMEDEVDEWNEAVKTLDKLLAHLKIVRNLEAELLCMDSDESYHLIRIFDLSRGDSSQLDRILQLAVTSDISGDSFRRFVTLLPHTSQTFEQLLTSLLKTAITKFKCKNGTQEAKLLYGVLQRIQENLKHECSILPHEVEILCADPNLTPEIRLKALEILQSLKPHAVRSDTTLLYRQTQATIVSSWPQSPISFGESDLATEKSREQLFSKLLQHASAWRHLLILKDLLNYWPPFTESCSEMENPWVRLTYRILISEDRLLEEAEMVLEEIFQITKIPVNSIQHLVSLAEGSSDVSLLLLLCLLPNDSALNSTVYSLVHKYMQANNLVLSDKLLSLLLYNGLASSLITTPAYGYMIEYLLQNCSSDVHLWKSIIDQLLESGHYPEAGMLHLLQMGVSSSLNVFPAVLSYLKSTTSEE